MRDCRFHQKGNCENPNHCEPFCSFEDKDLRFRCWDYEGANK